MKQIGRFTAYVELNGKKICAGDGLNKKEAKADCAKNALAVIAPNVYTAKYC